MELRVERERCMGTGVCALTSPEVFDQDDDGKVTQLDPAPPAGSPPPWGPRGRPASVEM
ncbi:ferredoxin, partial [Streptomyces sp. NPDC048161]|uniref:ferredoxin n=1 Tax=Streptomyces sp. NPDC048161 TaxID=3160985 RepID=UPI0033E1750B